MIIGDRLLGTGCPVFVIAEIGSNYSTLDDCFKSIDVAAEAGADAVKFQMFTQEELYGDRIGSWTNELPRGWIRDLALRCKERGVEFMCSAFSPDGVRFVDQYVSAHKIASAEASHPGIVQACTESSKPTFVSSGALEWDEFQELVSRPWPSGVIPMYCRASYPANDARPWVMAAWDMVKGMSDHTPDVFPLAVPIYGYNAIEKHVNFVGAAGPDADHSLSAADFARMVRFLRFQLEDEHPPEDMAKFHRRRYVEEFGGFYRVRP